MELNRELLQQWFRQFNCDIFANELPELCLFVSNSKTRMGVYVERYQQIKGFKNLKNRSIRISRYYNCSEKEFQDTLIHEMIHYYISYKEIKDTSSHGVMFKRIMNEINHKHGRNVSISIKRNDKLEENTQKNKLRLILALQTIDNTFMLSSVNPAYARSIKKVLDDSVQIKKYAWFTSKDAYFNSYSTVRTPRGRVVTEEFYDKIVSEMQPFNLKK